MLLFVEWLAGFYITLKWLGPARGAFILGIQKEIRIDEIFFS